jgi:hypothetical protein
MWARVVELMLGVWLILSPLIFRGTPGLEAYVVNDVIAGSLAVAFALLCFWRPTRRAHLATLLLGAYLALFGYFSADRPGPPAAQNDIVIGLLLMIFAVVPTEAARPPEPWRRAESDGAP